MSRDIHEILQRLIWMADPRNGIPFVRFVLILLVVVALWVLPWVFGTELLREVLP